MNRERPVVIRRGGFLSAVAYGFFGFLITLLIVVGGVALYAIRMVDHKTGHLLEFSRGVLTAVPEYVEALPPVVSDMLDDQRAPGYRDHVGMDVRLVDLPGQNDRQKLLIDVTNNGSEMITLMAVRVVLSDSDDVPVRAISTYAATPATIDSEWRGPILPGSTRRCALTIWTHGDRELTPQVEITDLRIWSEAGGTAPAASNRLATVTEVGESSALAVAPAHVD